MSELYATAQHLRELLAEEMDNPHLLAFVLTTDHEKAEECLVPGIAGDGNENPMFGQWAREWARRMIIRNAIRIVGPRRERDNQRPSGPPSDINFGIDTKGETHPEITRLLRVGDFERFVTVMSVFEGYSDQDCSVLLGCLEQDVREARERAIKHLSTAEHIQSTGCYQIGEPMLARC